MMKNKKYVIPNKSIRSIFELKIYTNVVRRGLYTQILGAIAVYLMAKTCGTVGRESNIANGGNTNHQWSKYGESMLGSCILAIVLKHERILVSIEEHVKAEAWMPNQHVPS
jgi:hypothetical protein